MAARLCLLATTLFATSIVTSATQSPRVHTFEQVAAGSLPPGFTTASVRQTEPDTWSIARVGSTSALHHAASGGGDGWSLALAPDVTSANLRLIARVRLAGGSHTGGLVWHYVDARNFMAVLLDLDDGDLELFRVQDGNRVRLEDRDGLELDREAWHTIKVVHDDGRTTVSIGGIRVLDWNERRPGGRRGRAGVVAHGTSDAAFDDLRIETHSGGRSSR